LDDTLGLRITGQASRGFERLQIGGIRTKAEIFGVLALACFRVDFRRLGGESRLKPELQRDLLPLNHRRFNQLAGVQSLSHSAGQAPEASQ